MDSGAAVMNIIFDGYSDAELIAAHSGLLRELRARRIIKGNNFAGDLGEAIATHHYNSTSGLPHLSKPPTETSDFEAVGDNGKRYCIRATSGPVTASFFGLPAPDDYEVIPPKFDFVVVVKFDRDYTVQAISELTWDQFLAIKQWLPTQHAYTRPVSNKVLSGARSVFTRPH